ncbi:GNAT family N-acetyltransferase [Paenibacillus abyssi]|uniref:N-acetyltransferase n=1 Tax=Paenibacillus abyssi TaxID=1340531 RepID=A0A917D592_9BACL|nr:GNAT family N-acetyltransferase [Paenibacillus abyssi]GGG13385.1 N-acetyltransferase [Paenibacillus abyssi]
MRETIQEGNGFHVIEDGQVIGEITYVILDEHTLKIDHTYVDPALRGQKIAEDLVKRVVDYAREAGKKIVPACTYADAQFRRRKEYHDVWAR